MFVEKHFPPSAKERMLELVGNLKIALGERIDQLDWMSDLTKTEAHQKLFTIKVKIGYPDKWRDYSGLEVKEDSYFRNVMRASEFNQAYRISKIGKPVDPDEWGMTPQTVNAYYSPSRNEIVFPAGILQPPFFYMDADDAVNYGAIGVVIGHEMTHGFDDQGRKFDKQGNLADWWTEDDARRFNERAKVLTDQFNKFVVLDSVPANGELTLGENIADLGGLNIAFTAVKKAWESHPPKTEINGFTPEQRFFLAYAHVWAQNITDKEILRRTKEDVHSLGKFRVNGPLRNMKEFYEAFGIINEAEMFIAEEERANIW
jgi:putative endopeptidase